MTGEAKLEVRRPAPDDAERVRAARNAAFAAARPLRSAGDPRALPVDAAAWRRRYAEAPHGAEARFAEEEGGAVANHLGCLRIPTWIEGEAGVFGHLVDGFARPAAGLRHDAAFTAGPRALVDALAGPPPEGPGLLYALVERPEHRLAEHFLGTKTIHDVLKLVADPAELVRSNAGEVRVEEVAAFPELDGAALLDRVAEGIGAIAARGTAALDWRYSAHPALRHRIALARRGDALVGYAVYRAGAFDGEAGGLLEDWIAPATDDAVRDALLVWATERAREDGAPTLTCVLPPTAAAFGALQRAGFRVRLTRFFLIGRWSQRRHDHWWLHRNWYYTLGDLLPA